MSLGKYEREALERRRDELMRARATSGLSVGQGRELDAVISQLDSDDFTLACRKKLTGLEIGE